MTDGMKLMVLVEPLSESLTFGGTAIRVTRLNMTLAERTRGRKHVWQVEKLASPSSVTEKKEMDAEKMVDFLADCKADNLLVSVNDSLPLLSMILRPRVSINLDASTIEYFELEIFADRLIERFKRDLQCPPVPVSAEY